MPDDLQQLAQLQRKIEEGLAAARELKRLDDERTKQERPKLRLIKGGLIGGAIWAGVEWFRDYRRTAATLMFSGLAAGGVIIAEEPGSPGSDPPEAFKPPASVNPSVKPPAKPVVTPRPPRTSPPRTPARNSIPVSVPTASLEPRPSRTPKPTVRPSAKPSKPPKQEAEAEAKPTVSVTTTPLPALPVETPTVVSETCTINLLGIEACLPLG